MSNTHKTAKLLKSVWGDAGLEQPPQPEEVAGNVQKARKKSPRSPKHGGVMVGVRLTREEKRRLETAAFNEQIPIGELISRLLDQYEQKHKSR